MNRTTQSEIWEENTVFENVIHQWQQFTAQKTNITNLWRNFYMKSNLRNEIKSYIVRQGMTMQEVVDLLADEYGWSDSVSNLSNKLQRESLRYTEAVQLAEVLGFEIVWRKRGDK